MKSNRKHYTTKQKTFRIIFILVFIVLIISLIFILLTPKETYVHGDGDAQMVFTDILQCKSSNPDVSFFTYDAEKSEHTIKIIFKDNKINKINYTFDGNFSSDKKAETTLSQMHAEYNTYMGGTSIYQENLTPTFSLLGSEIIINLFIDEKYFVPSTAKIVFLDGNEYVRARDGNIDEIEEIYKSKGFLCDYKIK